MFNKFVRRVLPGCQAPFAKKHKFQENNETNIDDTINSVENYESDSTESEEDEDIKIDVTKVTKRGKEKDSNGPPTQSCKEKSDRKSFSLAEHQRDMSKDTEESKKMNRFRHMNKQQSLEITHLNAQVKTLRNTVLQKEKDLSSAKLKVSELNHTCNDLEHQLRFLTVQSKKNIYEGGECLKQFQMENEKLKAILSDREKECIQLQGTRFILQQEFTQYREVNQRLLSSLTDTLTEKEHLLNASRTIESLEKQFDEEDKRQEKNREEIISRVIFTKKIVQNLMAQLMESEVIDEDSKEFYNENVQMYTTPEEDINPDVSTETREEKNIESSSSGNSGDLTEVIHSLIDVADVAVSSNDEDLVIPDIKEIEDSKTALETLLTTKLVNNLPERSLFTVGTNVLIVDETKEETPSTTTNLPLHKTENDVSETPAKVVGQNIGFLVDVPPPLSSASIGWFSSWWSK